MTRFYLSALMFYLVTLEVSAAPSFQQRYAELGLSLLGFQPLYEDEKNTATVLPHLEFQYDNFYLRDLELGYLFVQDYQQEITLSLAADRFSLYKVPSGSRAKGKQDAINLKGGISRYYNSGLYTATVMTDISEVHDGSQVELSWFYPQYSGYWTWYGGIYGNWMDRHLVEHYYTTKSPVPGYKAQDGWSIAPTLSLDYQTEGGWLFNMAVMVEFYSPEIYKSPLIEHRHRGAMNFTIIRQF